MRRLGVNPEPASTRQRPRPLDTHRTTFPLPPEEIRKEKRRAFLTSKQVWLPFLVLAATGILLELPLPALLPLLVLAFFVLALVWQARSGRLLAVVAERIVRRSNRAQDAALVGRIRACTASGHDGHAVTLGKFLEAKQAIEARLHAEGIPATPGGEAVEKLVDGICFGVADAFDAVVALDERIRALDPALKDELRLLRARQKEHLTCVIEAYKAVKAARADLDLLVASARPPLPASDPAGADADTLAASVARLREETRAAVDGQIRATRDAR